MGWFSKKKEENFNLPQLPELPDNTRPALPYNYQPSEYMPPKNQSPSYPKSISMPDAIEQPEEHETEYPNQEIPPVSGMQKSRFNLESPLPQLPKTEISRPILEEHEHFMPPKPVQLQKTRVELPKMPKEYNKQIRKKDEPVFIRLDKFQTTIDAFNEIKNKVTEIESLLARTKELKQKEEKELEEWEREIESIKMKIDSIDREISNEMD